MCSATLCAASTDSQEKHMGQVIRPHHHHQQWRPRFFPLCQTLAGGLVDVGCTRRSCWRHTQCPPAKGVITPLVGQTRLSVAMALAELHHSANRTVLPKKEEVKQHYALHRQKPARAGPGTQHFSLGDESVPEPVGEPQVQAWVQRHTVEHLADVCPFVQIHDAPVPHMVDDVVDSFRLMDLPIAEHVIEVPKVSSSSCPSRVVLMAPQVVEQLVGVPTTVSYSSLRGLFSRTWFRTAFCGAERRHWRLHVPGDHPGYGRLHVLRDHPDYGRLLASPPGQGSRARRGAHVRGGGGQGSVPGQSSTAPHGAESGVVRQRRASLGAFGCCLQPEYGFIESDSAKAAFGHALVGDIRFFFKGSVRLDDWVTFSVGEGPHGLEAFDLEVVWGVRGLASLTPSWMWPRLSSILAVQLRGNYIVDSGSGMCHAGHAGVMLFSRCVPFCCLQAQMLGSVAGVKQKGSCVVSLRPRSSLFPAVARARLVLLVSRPSPCSYLLSSGPGARHHGWFLGSLSSALACAWLVLLVSMHLTLLLTCPLCAMTGHFSWSWTFLSGRRARF